MLVAQLRQLGVHRACATLLLKPLERRRRGSLAPVGGPSDAARELAAELLYLTSTGDGDYAAAVAECPLEDLATFACAFDARPSRVGCPVARARRISESQVESDWYCGWSSRWRTGVALRVRDQLERW